MEILRLRGVALNLVDEAQRAQRADDARLETRCPIERQGPASGVLSQVEPTGVTVAHRQAVRLNKLRADRSSEEVARRLSALRTATKGKDNLMPFIYDAVKAYATLGEICDTMRDTFGTYEEVAIT